MAVADIQALKSAARQEIDGDLAELVHLSHTIHDHPETAFEEDRACAWTSEALAAGGFAVTQGVAGMPTAFSAESGSGPLVVAVCAEYDALPGVGHACGHNIIAASAVGAGLGLARVADELGITVRVLGTPAEEGGGGKVTMLEHGVFDDVHAAMMIHPWPEDRLEGTCLAVSHFDVTFTGKSAHASAAPWEGINAGDAMTIAQVAIGLLRQQLRPGDQVHGIVTGGGQAANIIPDEVTGRFMCRSTTLAGLALLEPRVTACFDAGALATGIVGDLPIAGPGLLAHGVRRGARLPSTGPTPRPSAGPSPSTTSGPHGRRSPPTWPTCRWPSPPSTRWWASRPGGRSTTSPSSPPPA